jgi:hypothetical protein
MTSEKSVERSIDTLQRIYAVIAALAINEGLKRVFLGQERHSSENERDELGGVVGGMG